MEKTIEIPEGYEARIEGNKVILEKKESEDERIRKELVFYFGDMPEDTELRNGITNRDVLVWFERQKERGPSEWKDLLHDVYSLPYHKEQKFTEWSEGAKKMLDEISDYLKYKGREEDADFIRHLHPQPHWKPSEEQIRALERAIVKMHTPDDIDILAELRDVLKKLSL